VTEGALNREKIQELARKLGGLDEGLTDEERSILIGILGTASNALADVTSQSEYGAPLTDENQEAVSAGPQTMESRQLSEAFLLFFTPGHAGKFVIPPELKDVVARVIRG
jgi:hypothetical protein